MGIKEHFQRFKEYHPIFQAFFYFSLLTIPSSAISLILNFKNQYMLEAMRTFLATENPIITFYKVVIKAPVIEEITYRGPAFLILLLCGLISMIYRFCGVKEVFLDRKLFLGITFTDIIVWPTILVADYFWAIQHPYPLTVFIGGIVFGWLLMKTRNIFYTILFHSFINAIFLITIVLGSNILY